MAGVMREATIRVAEEVGEAGEGNCTSHPNKVDIALSIENCSDLALSIMELLGLRLVY
jgi:hypothetical protein